MPIYLPAAGRRMLRIANKSFKIGSPDGSRPAPRWVRGKNPYNIGSATESRTPIAGLKTQRPDR